MTLAERIRSLHWALPHCWTSLLLITSISGIANAIRLKLYGLCRFMLDVRTTSLCEDLLSARAGSLETSHRCRQTIVSNPDVSEPDHRNPRCPATSFNQFEYVGK